MNNINQDLLTQKNKEDMLWLRRKIARATDSECQVT